LKIDPIGAWNSNPLFFVVILVVSTYFILDFKKFIKKIS
jgi:hypothetical protein